MGVCIPFWVSHEAVEIAKMSHGSSIASEDRGTAEQRQQDGGKEEEEIEGRTDPGLIPLHGINLLTRVCKGDCVNQHSMSLVSTLLIFMYRKF